MKNKYALILIMFSIALAWSGCKDCDDPSDPDCGNYDPCFGQQEFVPHFEMMYGISHWSGEDFIIPGPFFRGPPYILFEGDTLMTNYVYFRAPREYDSVWWRIGGEGSFRHGKDVTLDFDQLYPSNLPIIMIGTRKPNKPCFPNEQAIDTVTRFLTLWPYDSTKLLGKWIGAYDTHPNDSFEIEIKFKPNSKELIIDYLPDRDLKAPEIGPVTYKLTKTDMYGAYDTGKRFYLDRYRRRFHVGYTMGSVYGTNYQHLEIKLKYSYDSVSPVVKHDIKFNARRK